MAFAFLSGIGGTVFSLIFNLYMSALGFRNDVIGLFNALPGVAVLLVGLPLAALADRIGYRFFLLGGTAVATVGALGLAVVGAPLPAVLASGTYALAGQVLAVLSVPLLAQLSTPSERVALFSLNTSLSWVASLLGELAGGAAPEAAARVGLQRASSAPALRAAFVVMAILTVATVPLVVRLARAARLRPAETFPVAELLRVDLARFARILVPQLILGIAAGMLLNFTQLYLAQRFHLTPGPIGIVLAAIALVAAPTSLLSPLLSRRLGMSRAIGLCQAAGFPLVLVIALTQSLPVAVAILVVRQLVLNLQGPLFQVFGMEYVEARERARLAITQNATFAVGFGGIGPLLSGILQVRGGYQLAFSVSAVCYLLAGTVFLALFARTRLPSPT